jgi:hypothetical protein
MLARLYRVGLIQGIHNAGPDPPVRAGLIQGIHYAGPDQPVLFQVTIAIGHG